MKKILAIITFLVIASLTICFAEEEPFYAGLYRVGVDFKPGSYNIHLKAASSNASRIPKAYIKIYDSEEALKKNDHYVSDQFKLEGYHLSAVEGMIFDIEVLYNGELSIVNESLSWMMD